MSSPYASSAFVENRLRLPLDVPPARRRRPAAAEEEPPSPPSLLDMPVVDMLRRAFQGVLGRGVGLTDRVRGWEPLAIALALVLVVSVISKVMQMLAIGALLYVVARVYYGKDPVHLLGSSLQVFRPAPP